MDLAGQRIPDSRVLFKDGPHSSQSIASFLGKLGQEGVASYNSYHRNEDLMAPIARGVAVTVLYSSLIRYHSVFLPLLIANILHSLCDLGENYCLNRFTQSFPHQPAEFDLLLVSVNVFNPVKWLGGVSIALGLGYVIITTIMSYMVKRGTTNGEGKKRS